MFLGIILAIMCAPVTAERLVVDHLGGFNITFEVGEYQAIGTENGLGGYSDFAVRFNGNVCEFAFAETNQIERISVEKAVEEYIEYFAKERMLTITSFSNVTDSQIGGQPAKVVSAVTDNNQTIIAGATNMGFTGRIGVGVIGNQEDFNKTVALLLVEPVRA